MLAEEVSVNWKDIEDNIATNIFYVEKELGAYVTDEYPLVKLNFQIDELNKHMEREAKEIEKSKRR